VKIGRNFNRNIVPQISSPSNGAHTIEDEDFLSPDSGSPLYGDIHFYVYDKVWFYYIPNVKMSTSNR
jgi:hypothetical protein